MAKSNLNWTNITRDDAPEQWDMFMAAKAELEQALGANAVAQGLARQGDGFKFAYRNDYKEPTLISVGMAIAAPTMQRSTGLGGLRRGLSLDTYQRNQDNGGYRR
jgi:hypothetical protein